MTGRAASRPSPIIFAVILASASIVSFLIVVSPYILTFHDPGAISVSASVNPTEVGQNQAIKVTVSDVNGLRIPNELPLSGDWRVQNLSMGPCAFYTAYPYGIAVYQGRYTIDNVSSAKSIMIYAPGISNCPTESISNSFTFKPLQNASSYVDLRGYWTAGVTPNQYGGFSEGVLHPFLPEEYTLAAGDEWGHVDILYFQVTSSSSPTTSTGSISTQGGETTGTQTTGILSSSTGVATASVSNSSDGLSLNLQVLPGGNGTFTVTAYESNLLSSVNNVTEANQWKYPADLLNPANNCAPTNDPVGFAIFQGYYGMSNYTSGKALPLYNTNVVFHCTENIYANDYLFQPQSDSISVYNHGQFETNGTASLSLLTGGYWTGGAGTPTSASFSEFRGVYTVLAADEWGNVLLLHFTVD